MPEHACHRCGYDLSGLTAGEPLPICPKCGKRPAHQNNGYTGPAWWLLVVPLAIAAGCAVYVHLTMKPTASPLIGLDILKFIPAFPVAALNWFVTFALWGFHGLKASPGGRTTDSRPPTTARAMGIAILAATVAAFVTFALAAEVIGAATAA